ncbi:peptide deformylase [Blautia sp.]|uniref:peptide deformylase n=1 Tax=Blautia sp. TaxID=1955243 RepID=UPI00258AB535|nr:peptide deformylase [Blautia sp.]
MVRTVVRDTFFLSQTSEPAGRDDDEVVRDLLDTLQANRERCVGMAANMIGIKKRIIVVSAGEADLAMLNPVIIKKSMPYDTEEGCLSLEGSRKSRRYETIEVEYRDRDFKRCKQRFKGWTAQIIQHEIDYCDGIVI